MVYRALQGFEEAQGNAKLTTTTKQGSTSVNVLQDRYRDVVGKHATTDGSIALLYPSVFMVRSQQYRILALFRSWVPRLIKIK